MRRRQFIKNMGAGSLMIGAGVLPSQAFNSPEITKLTILHTNDVHSRIEPFPMDGSRNEGLGGTARRAAEHGAAAGTAERAAPLQLDEKHPGRIVQYAHGVRIGGHACGVKRHQPPPTESS